ncbi:MAG: hypothetical protein GY777_06110 [Candidatus Brocadiaceae bacterium]|nr:hypothetical protein [Candidatus Brocadiaceae bacterium]
MKSYNIPRVGIIKIDVEGGELEVIEGICRMISGFRFQTNTGSRNITNL